MQLKISLIAILSLIGFSLKCQNIEDEVRKGDIRIYISRQWNDNYPIAGSVLSFNKYGRINFIYKGTLNPIMSNVHKYYCAKYEYSKEGRLSEEILYEIDEEDTFILRTTKYFYHHDTLSIIVKSQIDGKTLAEIIEFKKEEEIVRKYLSDEVLGKGLSPISNSTVNCIYRNNELVELTQNYSQSKMIRIIRIQNEGNKKIITNRLSMDTLTQQHREFRFYKKNGCLVKISLEDNVKNWNVKFCYGKKGVISKIIRRGRLNNSKEKVRSNIIFDVKVSRGINDYKNLKGSTINNINNEIINMYHPISGRMNDLNYFDSRRFISSEG